MNNPKNNAVTNLRNEMKTWGYLSAQMRDEIIMRCEEMETDLLLSFATWLTGMDKEEVFKSYLEYLKEKENGNK